MGPCFAFGIPVSTARVVTSSPHETVLWLRAFD